ncbi:MAG: DUF4145 domain-containing protein [Thaumarchaeota archaeon]|nr:DUF4145 domain-containing protein [Nitrososphaerota archaeon]
MGTEVISIRVDKKVKEEAARLGVDVREVVENALEEAILRQKESRLKQAIENVKREMKSVSEEEWVQAIKSSRKRRAGHT